MEESANQETRHMSLSDLIPSGWFERPEASSIWLTGYQVLRVPQEKLIEGPRILDLSDVRAIVFYGKMNYLDTSQMKFSIITANEWRLDSGGLHRETQAGSYIMFIAPYMIDGREGNEAGTRQKIAIAVALFAALNGRNIVYEHVFDNIVEVSTLKSTGFGPVTQNPLSFPVPDVTDARLSTIRHADAAIANLSPEARNRVVLSLRWFEGAVYETSGIDSLLKYWIAVETLSMPDTSNIRPVNEALANAYGLSYLEARDRFHVGRLYGLRNRIVHEGALTGIHGEMLLYIEALYADLLLPCLGLACERRAERALQESRFGLDNHLRRL